MKKVLLATLVSVASSSMVMAADLGGYYKGPLLAPPGYDWTGLYVGGHVGGGWEDVRASDPTSNYLLFDAFSTFASPPFTGGPAVMNPSGSSFLGGLQAGANYQIGRLVLGTDFDWSWTSLKGSATGAFPTGGFNTTIGAADTFSFSDRWVATATTRLGVAHDNWLLYGKAGAAWTRSNYGLGASDTLNTNPAIGITGAGTVSNLRTGWTVGSGLEWAFAHNWTARIEYDYINFGTEPESVGVTGLNNFTGVPATIRNPSLSLASDVYQTISEVKFGINYKFDSGWLLFF